MAGYIGNIPVPQALRNYDVFTATSGQTVFNVKSYDPSFIDVYQNGVKLIDGDDYTATDGNTVVLASGATLNDIVEVISFTTFYPADVVSASAGGTFFGAVSFDSDVTVSGDLTIPDKIIHAGDTNTSIRFPAADTVTVETAGLERMLIDSDGNVGIGTSSPSQALDVVGNIEVSGGVYLGGTGAANYLDDYETGTWTPVISGGTSAGTGTYTLQSASYVKVGKMVSVVVRIEWTAHTGTGTINIPSFPFTTSSDNQAAFAIMHRNLNIGGSNKTALFYIGTSSTTGTVLGVEDNVNWTNPSMDSAGSIIFSGTYEAA